MCFEYIGEVEEMDIYETFLQKKSIENLLCRNKMGKICPPKKRRRKAKKPKIDEEIAKTEDSERSNEDNKKDEVDKSDNEKGTKDDGKMKDQDKVNTDKSKDEL